MAKEFTVSNFDKLLQSNSVVVADFWAEWCGPCRMITPIIEELAVSYEGKALIGKVNVDEENELATKYGIRNIPTIVFFKDGKIVDKQVGAAQKSAFESKINALL
ncbi:MAG: thioredoxin [Paludibacteraceae bacterium]|nr:thioredoxin [Paludibacteraceae bacterium]MBP6285225.1 thioredoxin [Paludibacteraceae bacterium]